jgi:hypothetical protein
MPIKRLDEFPAGNGSLTNDDIFVFMDDPASGGVTKKITLSQLSSTIGGGGGASETVVVSLGSRSGIINTAANSGDIFDVHLIGSGLFANPTLGNNGQTIRWRITHGASGIPVSLGNKFDIPSSASSPLPWSTSSGVMDVLAATYHSSRDKWDIIAFIPGY